MLNFFSSYCSRFVSLSVLVFMAAPKKASFCRYFLPPNSFHSSPWLWSPLFRFNPQELLSTSPSSWSHSSQTWMSFKTRAPSPFPLSSPSTPSWPRQRSFHQHQQPCPTRMPCGTRQSSYRASSSASSALLCRAWCAEASALSTGTPGMRHGTFRICWHCSSEKVLVKGLWLMACSIGICLEWSLDLLKNLQLREGSWDQLTKKL